jgi:hypothetical protein
MTVRYQTRQTKLIPEYVCRSDGADHIIAVCQRTLTASYAAQPWKPVMDGEVCYEGIMEASRQEVQRFNFGRASSAAPAETAVANLADFLANQVKNMVSIDFFSVPRTGSGSVILGHES